MSSYYEDDFLANAAELLRLQGATGPAAEAIPTDSLKTVGPVGGVYTLRSEGIGSTINQELVRVTSDPALGTGFLTTLFLLPEDTLIGVAVPLITFGSGPAGGPRQQGAFLELGRPSFIETPGCYVSVSIRVLATVAAGLTMRVGAFTARTFFKPRYPNGAHTFEAPLASLASATLDATTSRAYQVTRSDPRTDSLFVEELDPIGSVINARSYAVGSRSEVELTTPGTATIRFTNDGPAAIVRAGVVNYI